MFDVINLLQVGLKLEQTQPGMTERLLQFVESRYPTTVQTPAIDRSTSLGAVFRSVDQDGNGKISRTELVNRLQTDECAVIQKLLNANGGLGEFFAMEQLDLSQDGAITMEEFESGLTMFVDSKNNDRNPK